MDTFAAASLGLMSLFKRCFRMMSKRWLLCIVLSSVSLIGLTLTGLWPLDRTYSHASRGTDVFIWNPSQATDVCHGHYYLCRFRDVLTKSSMYKHQVHLHGHIHDFSNYTGFSTNVFKVYPKTELYLHQRNIATLKEIVAFMKTEFPQNWYRQALSKSNPDDKDLHEICTFKYDECAEYVTSIRGFAGSGWPVQVLIQVNETIISRVLAPNHIPYSDVYAIVSTSNTFAFCKTESYLDLDNMTQYSLSCPRVEDNFKVDIKSSFSTGSIYDSKCDGYDSRIHVQLQVYTQADFPMAMLPVSKTKPITFPACSSSTTQHVPGFWVKRKSIWHWSTYKCYFPITLNKKLENCLNKTNVIMFGDSHTRDRSYQFEKHFHCNLTYVATTVACHLLNEFRKHEPMLLNVTQPTVIMFNAGAWSFTELDPLSYMSDMLEVINLIRDLRRKSLMLKFIWVETVAMRPNRSDRRKFGENNIVAAMNDFVTWNMERIAVPVVKAYDISIPISWFATKDGTHYHQLFGQDAINNNQMASVGGAITTILIRTICNECFPHLL